LVMHKWNGFPWLKPWKISKWDTGFIPELKIYTSWYHVSHIDTDTIASWNWVPWIVDTRVVYEFEKFSAATSTTLVPHFRTDLCTRTRLLYQKTDQQWYVPV
jgi:hypothetical protein